MKCTRCGRDSENIVEIRLALKCHDEYGDGVMQVNLDYCLGCYDVEKIHDSLTKLQPFLDSLCSEQEEGE